MKNKLYLINFIYIIFLFIFKINILFADDVIINAETVEIKENGNLIVGQGDVNISDQANTKITGDKAQYNKLDQTLEVYGNVVFMDGLNNYRAASNKVIFNRKNNIVEITDNVILGDIKNNYKIYSEKVIYNLNTEVITSFDKTKINYKKQFDIITKDIVFEKIKQTFTTKENTTIKDRSNNKFELSSFKFNLDQEIFRAEKIKLYDVNNNNLILKNGFVDLKSSELIGSDFVFNFNKNIFGNSENDPRLIGRYIITDQSETKMKKSSYTTCKNNPGKCPTWSISAEDVVHEKEKKRLKYKNAWLEIYDIPVAYFPYFHHPDPTVKRQSGFLFPQFNNSSNLGFSTQIPYFKVIDHDKDMTISPRVFSNNNLFLQTEYRQAFKNSNLVSDFSYNKKNNSRSHFFSTFTSQIENSFYEMKIQTVSNKDYLKKYQIKSPLIEDYTVLNSSILYEKSYENSDFTSSINVFEDLSKKSSDKYEYVLPSYVYSNENNLNTEFFDKVRFKSSGNYRKFNTNVDEADLINDFIFTKKNQNFSNNLENDLSFLLRNINTHSNLSKKYKEDEDFKVITSALINFKYPMIKEGNNGKSFLTPLASLRYSPYPGINQKNQKTVINFNDLFMLDRISDKTVEKGLSSTLGFELKNQDTLNQDKINLGVGINFRADNDEDLPLSSSLGNKTSDLIGYSGLNITENLSFGYDFSIKHNLSDINYSLVSTKYKTDKFKTSFEYMEKSNFIGDESYFTNLTELEVDKSNSLAFETNRNIDKNLTNYYNLIYKYKNDCLQASLTYNKQFYDEDSVNAGKNIFFKISFIPFGTVQNSNINE